MLYELDATLVPFGIGIRKNQDIETRRFKVVQLIDCQLSKNHLPGEEYGYCKGNIPA
jgi:hypothetical protein